MNTEEKNQNNSEANPISDTAKKTYLLILVLALIVVGLLAVAFLPKPGAPSNTISNSTPSPLQTSLTIDSNPVQSKTNPSKFTEEVAIDSGQNSVTAVQLELTYDPKALTNVDIVPGDFFTNPNVLLKKIDPSTGRITYAIGVPLGQKGVTGKKNVAEISFSIVLGYETKPISINFEPKTSVSAEGYAQSVAKSLTGSLFILKQAKPSPTP